MQGFKFSKKSRRALVSVDKNLEFLADVCIRRSKIDFAVTEGHRTAERQMELYGWGRNGDKRRIVTYKDGIVKVSAHQLGRAIDIVPYINGKYDWDNKEAFRYLRALFTEQAREWNIDIKLLEEWDLPHIELGSWRI